MTYGLAIYDDNGDLVTEFAGGETVLRKVYTTTTNTNSSGTAKYILTGLTELNSSNSLVVCQGTTTSTEGGGNTANIPARMNSNGRIQIANTTTQRGGPINVRLTVLQYGGKTAGTSSNYGLSLENGDGDVVIDENSLVLNVQETHDVNANLSNVTKYTFAGNAMSYFKVDLSGTYPISAGTPVAGLKGGGAIFPPYFYGTDGVNYTSVMCVIPTSEVTSNNSGYNLAIMVDADQLGSQTPTFYGGNESGYGMEIYNSIGSRIWSSQFKQAIITNIVGIDGKFTNGVGGNGTNDYTSNYDGVSPPSYLGVDEYSRTRSPLSSYLCSSQTVPISGLNSYIPNETYVLSFGVAGEVVYKKANRTSPDFPQTSWIINASSTGGRFRPAITISNSGSASTSCSITMLREKDGPPNNTPNGQYFATDDMQRDNLKSWHPTGKFVLAKIK